MILEEFEGFFDKVAQSERVKTILLLQFHGLELFACECVTDEAKFQIEVMRVLWSQLTAPGFMVQIDDFLDSVTDKEVVLWGVSNDHLAFI